MIVAKTRMKKIPETCKKCTFSFTEWEFGSGYIPRFCVLTKKDCPMEKSEKNGCMQYTRPKDCPLMEIE